MGQWGHVKQKPFGQIFRYIHAYFDIFRHNQAYSGIIQAYSDIFRTLCNHDILRTLTYLEPEAYSEPCQKSTMKHFVKIVNSYNYLCKLQLLL